MKPHWYEMRDQIAEQLDSDERQQFRAFSDDDQNGFVVFDDNDQFDLDASVAGFREWLAS